MAVTLNANTSSGFVQTADTSGEISLQSNGTTRLSVLPTGVSGTLVQGTAVASTSGTSIDFTAIPSWVKRITVMLSGVSTNGTSFLQCQIGSSSVTTSGYAGGYSRGTTAASATSGLIIQASVNAGSTYYGSVVFYNLTGNTWLGSSNNITANSDAATLGNASVGLSGILDRIRITTVNGTDAFDAGTINIQYEG
jgi:hypothetical protein